MNDSPDPTRILPRILVVDLETTGLNADRHGILQIGAVWLTGGEGEFSIDCRMWDDGSIDDKALAFNGCSRERCMDKKMISEGEAVIRFLTWAGDEPFMLAGNNPSFDRSFLNAAFKRGIGETQNIPNLKHRVLDLHTLAVSYALAKGELVPSRGLYTDEIYAILDLPPEPRPHIAITGARKEAEALRMLMALPSLALEL
jgi:DNA polymerase III epsilon subunit-like protein